MQITLGKARWLVLLTMALVAAAVGRGWAQDLRGNQDDGKWHPTRAMLRLEDYAGSASCAACHRAIFEQQKTSEMAQSGARPAESPALIAHSAMSFQRGSYTYSLLREGGQVIYTVNDGHDKIAEPVFIALGANGQLYFFRHHGEYYRAAVTYSFSQGKLGLDEDFKVPAPASLEAALGQRVTAESLRSCLRCHSPGTVAGDRFDLDHRVPGDDCESCHGPGAKHVAAMRAGKVGDSLIFNPAHLRPQEELDFCGDCHHTSQQVKEGVFRGVRTVIPQAYRLAQSRCWNAADPRSRCTFCHDPHAPLVREAAAQDAKCLACHASSAAAPLRADHPGKACPVGQKDCVHCHMPKVSVPGSTMAFTDHRIRIAPPGTPYPE
jgi:Zn finger protein HypA/HybF involved in hydrogenase expression